MWQRKSLLPGPNSGEIKSSLNVGSYVTSVQFSPSGDTVAASYVTSVHYGVVQIIDVATAEVKRPALPTRHSSWVRSVSWSPDGTKLASGSKDKTLRTWEVATGKELSQLRGHGQAVSSLAFKPDDPNVLVTGSHDQTVKLRDLCLMPCPLTRVPRPFRG